MTYVRPDGVKLDLSGRPVGRLTPAEMAERDAYNNRVRGLQAQVKSLAADVNDTSTGALSGATLSPPPDLSGLQSATYRELQSRARSSGRDNPELVIPPGRDGAPPLPAPGIALPDASPSRKMPDPAAVAAGLHRARATPPTTASTMARAATQRYVDATRRNGDVRRAIVSAADRPAQLTPESGTLPGEEQVTTRDTLRQLSHAEQTALQRKFESGGHANTMSYDDWLSENFGELPPADRATQMRSSATATPRINIGKDPYLETGENSGLAASRIKAGIELPEGREPTQYTAAQRKAMQENRLNPDIPMSRFGGTYTHDPAGVPVVRAPDPAALQHAAAIAADQGDLSPSHIAALAQAYGIDVHQYGDDLDMLKGDVLREKQIHDKRLLNNKIVPTGTGSFRYENTDERKSQLAAIDREKRVSGLRQRFQGMQGESGGKTVEQLLSDAETAMGSQNGQDSIRQIETTLRRIREGNLAQNVRNRRQNYHISQDLSNPNYAPGMGVRSLMEAVASNNPLQMAAVHDIYGNPAAALQHRQLAGVQAQAAADVASAEEEARAAMAKQEPQDAKRVGEEASAEYKAALAIPDAAQRYSAVERIVGGMNKSLTPEQVAEQAQNIIASHLAATNGVQDPFVQHRLSQLRATKNKDAFTRFAMSVGAAANAQEAEWLFNNPTAPKSAYERGQDMANSIRTGTTNAVSGVGGFVKGALGMK